MDDRREPGRASHAQSARCGRALDSLGRGKARVHSRKLRNRNKQHHAAESDERRLGWGNSLDRVAVAVWGRGARSNALRRSTESLRSIATGKKTASRLKAIIGSAIIGSAIIGSSN